MSSRSLYHFLTKKCGFKEVSIGNRKHVSWEMDWRGCVKNDIFVLKLGSSYEGFTYACGELVVIGKLWKLWSNVKFLHLCDIYDWKTYI